MVAGIGRTCTLKYMDVLSKGVPEMCRQPYFAPYTLLVRYYSENRYLPTLSEYAHVEFHFWAQNDQIPPHFTYEMTLGRWRDLGRSVPNTPGVMLSQTQFSFEISYTLHN